MEVKEKAKELVATYSGCLPWYSEKDNLTKSKELAKIDINNTLKVLESLYIEVLVNDRMKCNETLRLQEYYKSVLKEIDNI